MKAFKKAFSMKALIAVGMMVLTSVAFANGTQQASKVALEVLQESHVIQGFHGMNAAARAAAIRQLLETANPRQLAAMASEVQKRLGGNTKVSRDALRSMLLKSASELDASVAQNQGSLTNVANTVRVEYQGPSPLTEELKGVSAERESTFYAANSKVYTLSGVEMVDDSTQVETCLRKFRPTAADNVVRIAEETLENVEKLADEGKFQGLLPDERAFLVANQAYYPAFLEVTERQDTTESKDSLKKFAKPVEEGGCGGSSRRVAKSLR